VADLDAPHYLSAQPTVSGANALDELDKITGYEVVAAPDTGLTAPPDTQIDPETDQARGARWQWRVSKRQFG
jgi:hypothetical protein